MISLPYAIVRSPKLLHYPLIIPYLAPQILLICLKKTNKIPATVRSTNDLDTPNLGTAHLIFKDFFIFVIIQLKTQHQLLFLPYADASGILILFYLHCLYLFDFWQNETSSFQFYCHRISRSALVSIMSHSGIFAFARRGRSWDFFSSLIIVACTSLS